MESSICQIESSRASSPASDDMSSIDVGEITEVPEYESLSIAAILYSCKRKILLPYLRVMAVMGLRPLTLYYPETWSCLAFVSHVYVVLVLLVMCTGYVLQYLSCFRRDRGFCYKMVPIDTSEDRQHICYGNVFFSYVLPNLFQFSAYVYAICVFRVFENEQLQNLMERVFLLSSNPSNGLGNQKRLVKTLWISVGVGLFWMGLSLVSVNIMMTRGTILFQWIDRSPEGLKVFLKVVLIFCTLWQDMVQVTIITSYCLQGQLLISHLHILRDKVLQHILQPLAWMKEIEEFKKLLKYFNDDLAPIVCILTIVNVSWAASGITWLLKYDTVDSETVPIEGISVLNVALWVFISAIPFVQAARLTSVCQSTQSVGHEVRVRPFGHQNTPGEDLDTILLYASSLKLKAKLFCVPVTGKYLCLLLTLGTVILLTLGQCHILH